MFKQSPRRNQRSKCLKIKHVLQIGLLLGVCIWLLYQVKHSHDKKASFVDNARASDTLQIENDVVKLGRKDLPRQKEGAIIRDDQQKEDEEEEENKNEEKHSKLEDIESAGKGGEEDDLHRDELEKTEEEVNGKGDFDDKEARDGRERNNGQDMLKEHEDSQEDNKGEDNEKADEVSQKESEEGKEDGEENDENGGESNGKEVSEKNEVEENNENEVEENKENSENGNTENEKENQVNESEMKVEEGKSSEEKENEEKEKEESKAEKEKSEEHEPEQEQREDNRERRAEDKDGHIEQVVLSENQVQDGNDSHNQGAREEHYKNDDASSAVVHETLLLNESDSGHSENTSGEVHAEFKEKFDTKNENRGTFETNQENKDKLQAEQENKENRESEQENKEYHESEQENKENHEGEQESKENPERQQESKENPERQQESKENAEREQERKENHETEQESKENHESEQEKRETNETWLENKENNEAGQENKENNETGPENKEENTDLNQIESGSIINETQSVDKNTTSYSFMDTTLDSAHNQNELNPVLEAVLNHTEKVATDEKSDSSVILTTANQGSTNWNSTNDSSKVSSEDQTFSSNPSEGTENDDTSQHTGIGGNEVLELSNRVGKLESNEENHVDSAKEDLPSTFSENKQNENERTVDGRENSNADKISEGDEEASLTTNSVQEARQHESGNSSLPEHEKEARKDLETLPESTIAGHNGSIIIRALGSGL